MKILTLECRQWMNIHSLLHDLLTSPEYSEVRAKTGSLDLRMVRHARDAIKVSVSDSTTKQEVTIEETDWLMSRILWAINESAGYSFRYLTRTDLGKINNQLQRSV